MFEEYKQLCANGQIDIGKFYIYKTANKWILNFPTKRHWRSPSEVEYIEEGLKALTKSAIEMQLTDIAMPKLGCGNGGLDWDTQVKPIVEKYLKKAPINVSIYDFDKKIIPEYLKQKDIENWLRSEPENLNFSLFFEDLKNINNVNILFPKKIVLNNITFEVNYNTEDEYFLFHSKEINFILSKDDIKTMFYMLINIGKLCKNDIYTELQKYTNEIFDFLSQLSYIIKNEDKIILNYTKIAKEVEVSNFDD
jgi:hypothetical protein